MFGFKIIFFIIFSLIIFQWISTYIKNENSPIISTKAKLIKKKIDSHTHTDTNGAMSTTETLILKFQLDTGSELKFIVGRRVFKGVPENEWGTLTFQGTRFFKFEGESISIEK